MAGSGCLDPLAGGVFLSPWKPPVGPISPTRFRPRPGRAGPAPRLPPGEHQRLVVNPFLAVFSLIVWWLAARWLLLRGPFPPWPSLWCSRWPSSPARAVSCLDCGKTGSYTRRGRHACAAVLARWNERRKARLPIPSPWAQLVVWGWAARGGGGGAFLAVIGFFRKSGRTDCSGPPRHLDEMGGIGGAGPIKARRRPRPLGTRFPRRRPARSAGPSTRDGRRALRTGSCWSGSRTGAASRPSRPSRRWWSGTGRWSSGPAGRSSATPTRRRTPSRRRSCSWPGGPARSGSATRSAPGCTRSPAGSRPARGRPRIVGGPSEAAGWPAGSARPVDEPPRDDLGPALHEEVERLPERLRAPVVLCYLEGLTHEQAADHLACPVGTVRSRLARGRERLRRALARRGFAPPTEPDGSAAPPTAGLAGGPHDPGRRAAGFRPGPGRAWSPAG